MTMALKRIFHVALILASLVDVGFAFVGARSAFVAAPSHNKRKSVPTTHAWRQPDELRPIANGRQSETKLNAIMEIVGISPEPIHTAFSFATFGPQPFWLLLILLPKSDITKKLMGTMGM
jgi:hypothetical protein